MNPSFDSPETLACDWATPASHPFCEPGQVHVWCRHLSVRNAERAACANLLSADEQGRAGRFRFDRDRDRFVVRRGTLRMLLGQYLGVSPAEISLGYSPRGRPIVTAPLDASGMDFNVSHSHGLALFAFARQRRIGVDLEWVRSLDDAEAIAQRFFSASENDALQRIHRAEKDHAFFNCWTRKEAFVKATGEGLQRSLSSFDVTVASGEPARLLRWSDGDPTEWSISHLTPAAGFVGAIAASGQWELELFHVASNDQRQERP